MANILLVDDSPEISDLFISIFEKQDFVIETAISKSQFMVKLNTTRPDLILLEVLLEYNDSRGMCRELKMQRMTKNIPVILMSTNSVLLVDYKAFKADDYLEKPFNVEEVAEKVMGIIAGKVPLKNG